MPGIVCEKVTRPIERVGLYVPGGSAPLFSTALMLGVPSQIAGNPVRVLCTPPGRDGTLSPWILYAAQLCGITEVFKVGGAQAIAAMAYGTASIPKCDKLFGPGNAFVTEAKLQVSRDAAGAAIDLPAGPSEVLVIADNSRQAGLRRRRPALAGRTWPGFAGRARHLLRQNSPRRVLGRTGATSSPLCRAAPSPRRALAQQPHFHRRQSPPKPSTSPIATRPNT